MQNAGWFERAPAFDACFADRVKFSHKSCKQATMIGAQLKQFFCFLFSPCVPISKATDAFFCSWFFLVELSSFILLGMAKLQEIVIYLKHKIFEKVESRLAFPQMCCFPPFSTFLTFLAGSDFLLCQIIPQRVGHVKSVNLKRKDFLMSLLLELDDLSSPDFSICLVEYVYHQA